MTILPDKTNFPLLINLNTVLSTSIAPKRLQSVIGRNLQFIQFYCSIQHPQFPPCDFLNFLRQLARSTSVENLFRLLAFKRLNHEELITQRDNTVKELFEGSVNGFKEDAGLYTWSRYYLVLILKGMANMSSDKNMGDLSWKELKALSLKERGKHFHAEKHTLIAQQFNREQLEELCALATRIKRINKRRDGANFLKTLLSDKRAMLYFAQPSSRTYLSFLAACQILGLDTMDVRDSSTSSEVKGESAEDSLRTFSSYADLIIMRHPAGGFAERVAWMMAHTKREIPVLNAGSGSDQHPTQALLDVYTLARSFEKIGGIDSKHVVFVGDLMRGRTVRSLAWMLTLYKDVTLYFVAPESLQIGQDILDLLDQAGTKYVVTQDFASVMPIADAIYMTRIQDEWDVEGETRTTDSSEFRIGAEHMDIIKDTAVIMHPLPRRKEISTKIDNEPRAVYWRQMRNGMWIRAALILSSFGREDEVNQHYDDYKPEA